MDFAGAYTTRADFDAFGAPSSLHAEPLQIRIPTTIGEIMRVADSVAITWPLATNVAALRHDLFLANKTRWLQMLLYSVDSRR